MRIRATAPALILVGGKKVIQQIVASGNIAKHGAHTAPRFVNSHVLSIIHKGKSCASTLRTNAKRKRRALGFEHFLPLRTDCG
jgi:hypothetical protein